MGKKRKDRRIKTERRSYQPSLELPVHHSNQATAQKDKSTDDNYGRDKVVKRNGESLSEPNLGGIARLVEEAKAKAENALKVSQKAENVIKKKRNSREKKEKKRKREDVTAPSTLSDADLEAWVSREAAISTGSKEEDGDRFEKLSKKKKKDKETSSSIGTDAKTNKKSQVASEFPFPVDSDDHCESPANAYEDVLPFLRELENVHYNGTVGNHSEKAYRLKLYDPYYCDGAVKRNLSALGFNNVCNEKEDCYQVWNDNKRYPQFDIFITNPPYSGDHIEKLIQHLTSSAFARHRDQNKPPAAWFLLMPTWVHKKDYYLQAIARANIQPFYLVPRKRYIYLPPNNFRDAKKSDTHKKSSPFTSMWFCWGGTNSIQEQMIRNYNKILKTQQNVTCDLARTKNALRDLRRKSR